MPLSRARNFKNKRHSPTWWQPRPVGHLQHPPAGFSRVIECTRFPSRPSEILISMSIIAPTLLLLILSLFINPVIRKGKQIQGWRDWPPSSSDCHLITTVVDHGIRHSAFCLEILSANHSTMGTANMRAKFDQLTQTRPQIISRVTWLRTRFVVSLSD